MIRRKSITVLFKLSILLMVLTFGCSNDDDGPSSEIENEEKCTELSKLGEFFLLEESKIWLAYPDTISKIIFMDSSGLEYVGIVTNYNTNFGIVKSTQAEPCPLDNSISINYEWETETKRIDIVIEELDIKVIIRIRIIIDRSEPTEVTVADNCLTSILFPENTNTLNSSMQFNVDSRTHPNPFENYSRFENEYILNSRSYTDVYIREFEDDKQIDLFYNKNVGLVGLRSKLNPKITLNYTGIE